MTTYVHFRKTAVRAALPALLVLLGGLVACSDAASTVSNGTGAQLYARHCQSCHGDREGEGATVESASPHNETGHTWHHPDAQLRDWVLDGKVGLGPQMPAFGDRVSEQDVDAILAYVKTWWTESQREGQADLSRRYQEALDAQGQ